MHTSSANDGFRLAYERHHTVGGQAVVLLHGWPGDHADYRDVVPLLDRSLDVVVPDLRGFGASDKHDVDPADGYGAAAQARSIVALVEELGLRHLVIGGYDVGSRVAQAIAVRHPQLVEHLVVSPPLPGVGDRILTPNAANEFWYQAFHQLPLIEQLIDGNRDAVRGYLRYFWSHWSGPAFVLSESELDRLVDVYSSPGAFAASINWYRAGAGTMTSALAERAPEPADRIGTPTSILWQDSDPLFPREWSDRIDEFFSDATVHTVDRVGHFTPLECPHRFADLVNRAAAQS